MQLTNKQKVYFDTAKAVAGLSTYKKIHIGCVVVYQHRIISTGYNCNKSHPLQKKYNIYRFAEECPHTLHAEIKALLPLIGRKDINFSKVSIYNYRQYSNGRTAMSRPCNSCMALIRELGIKNIFYTGDNSYIAEKLF